MRHALRAAALLVASVVPAAARADVYVGTAFHVRSLVEHADQWADVRQHASGYYFHPRSGNEASELKGPEQKRITGLFARQRVVTERNNGGENAGDTKQYELMRDCGMTPVAGLVAEVNQLEPWVTRVGRSSYTNAAGETVTVPLVADQRPWTSAWNKTADLTLEQVDTLARTDDELAMRLKIMTAGAGFALETDNSRSVVDGRIDPNAKHFKICKKMLEYARSKHKTTMLFLHGFETADPGRYVEANLGFVRALEDARLYPDVLVCSFYTPESPLKLLPETRVEAGRRVPLDTLTGLAWAALAREGAVHLRDDERPRATVVRDGAMWTVRLENPNPAMDFCPAVTVAGVDPGHVTYAFDDEAFTPLTGDAVALVGPHRLTPGTTRTLRLRTDAAAVRLTLRHHAFAKESPATELKTTP